ERAQLLEVVQLAIEHEGLGRVRVDEALEGGAQLLLRLEPGSQPARLDETVLVPSPYETRRDLRLRGMPCLPDLSSGRDRQPDRAEQPDGTYCGRDRGDLLGPVRHGLSRRSHA